MTEVSIMSSKVTREEFVSFNYKEREKKVKPFFACWIIASFFYPLL